MNEKNTPLNDRKVAVIGAGLAGTVAAWHLARGGLKPVLFDREAVPGARAACGGVALEALAPQLCLPEKIIDHHVSRVKIVSGKRRRLLNLKQPIFISFDRGDLDANLADKAVALGCELRSSCRVTNWDPDSGRVEWKHDREAHSEVFDSVVIADGWKTVARGAGLGVGPAVTTATAFYRELEDGPEPTTDAAEFFFDMDGDDPGYYWIFPKNGMTQVGVGRVELGRGRPLREHLDEFIEKDPRMKGLKRLRSHGGVLPLELAKKTSRPGGMVVGDAAGLVNPLTGGGLVYAVASGEMAAQAILEGLAKDRDRRWIARRYDSLLRWSPHFWYLWVQGFPFRVYMNRVRAGRSFPFTAMFVFFASIMPRLAPAARIVTQMRVRRYHSESRPS